MAIATALGGYLGIGMAMDAWIMTSVAVTLSEQGKEVVGASRMLMS